MSRADAVLVIIIAACVIILIGFAVDELVRRAKKRAAGRAWVKEALAATPPPGTYAFRCDHCGAEVRKPITGLFSLAWVCTKCEGVYTVKAGG